VDEAGCEALNLNEVVIKAVDNCHYVGFTFNPLNKDSTANRASRI